MTHRPMRVLRLIARLNVGGPAQHVVWLNQALPADEFEPLLVAGTVPPGEEDMTAFAARHKVTPLIVPSMSREMSASDLKAVWDVWRLMVRFRPDLVHTHTAKAGAVGRLAGLLYRFFTPSVLWMKPRRCRFIHTYHGHIFHHYYGPAMTRVFLFIERLLARLNTDRLIVLSPQQLSEIRDGFRVGRASQYVVVPLGIDLSALEATPEAGQALRGTLGIGAGEVIVGIVGRLAAIKNHDLLLRVSSRVRCPARFVIYGDGGEHDRLVRRVAELGLTDRVIFADTRSAREIYSSLDVAALTSHNEGTPLAIIEAMATGKPVISTAVGGVVDLLGPVEQSLVEHGGSFEIRERGITTRSEDEAGFAAGLTRLLSDEPLRRRLIERGKAYVAEKHAMERLVRDIIGIYRELGAR